MGGSLHLTLGLLAVGGDMAEATARWILARSTRSGDLKRTLKGLESAGSITIRSDRPIDQRLLRLTGGARCRLLGGAHPEAEWRRGWDGIWRMVVFDVPESSTALRTRLRRRLHEFRFGWLQNSVWISPHPVDAFRQALGELALVPESLAYFEVRPIGGESHTALVEGAWDFPGIIRKYAAYRRILQLHPDQTTGTAAAWFRWLEAEHRAWMSIARCDPYLPLELQPPGYPGQLAWTERREALHAFARGIENCSRTQSRSIRAVRRRRYSGLARVGS
jgi:phenylacetic acid degradation operon negative regulatory protein